MRAGSAIKVKERLTALAPGGGGIFATAYLRSACQGAHLSIAVFSGAFLMMVALNYFFDEGKEVHWIAALERQMARFASLRGLDVAVVLAVMRIFATVVPAAQVGTFLFAGVSGLLTFLAVEVVGYLLVASEEATDLAAKRRRRGVFVS